MHNNAACLILDACQRSALAVTRSLGRQGLRVFTADCDEQALAGASRHSLRYFSLPSAQSQPLAYVETIADICRREGIDMVWPMTELSSHLLLTHRDILAEPALPLASLEQINALADKCSLVELAEQLDIPVPASQRISAASLPDFSTITPPFVLKPGKSWLQDQGLWFRSTVRFAGSEDEATGILQEDAAFRQHDYLLQENVPGHGEGVFALYEQGRAVAFFAHRRLREKPPRGGVSVLSQSRPVSPQLEAYARKLLDAVAWHGIAMVEFRVDEQGNAWLMEVNTRFWGSLQLAIDAGVDFPWLLYQIATGREPPPLAQYRAGRRLRWLLGDLDSLYLTLRDADFSLWHKLKAVAAFCTPHPFSTRHEVNRLADMGPFWWELKRYLHDLRR